MAIFFIAFCNSLSAIPSYMESDYPPEYISQSIPWKNRMRQKALQNIDEFLHFSIRGKLRSYALSSSHPELSYHGSVSSLRDFSHLYGYFSLFRPLVGRVSSSSEDLEIVRAAFSLIQQEITDRNLRDLAASEFLTKILAYRDLKEGDSFFLPVQDLEGNALFENYRVDHVFHLWGHMPAFGLVSEGKGPPLLLFRGTDLSLDSQRGWASLMSDVDLKGPGFYVFKKSQEVIHNWLVDTGKKWGKPQVLGFSLGGALAAYTFIFENENIGAGASYAFNPPGISESVLASFKQLPTDRQALFKTYVNRGDVVSKVGNLFGSTYELSTDTPLKPVTAHTALMTAYRQLFVWKVDVFQENSDRPFR